MDEKIVFVNTLDGSRFDAGAEKVIRLLRNGLESRGCSTKTLSIRPPTNGSVSDSQGATKIKSSNVYFPYPERPHSSLSKMVYHILENFNPVAKYRVLKSKALEGATVIFTHNLRGFSTAIWGMVADKPKTIKVHFLHDFQLACTASSMMKRRKECGTVCTTCRLFTRGRRGASSEVDIVYGASQYVLDRHIEAGFFPNALAFVMEPPLDVQKDLITRYIPKKIRTFGFLGRIVDEKGVSNLVDGFRQFVDSLPKEEKEEARLIVAGSGEGDFFESVISKINSTKGACYIGVTTPENIFSQIDALVVPSIWPDPNPFVVVEAYQHGIPVLAAHVGGLIKSVIHMETGIHFENNSSNEGMVAAMQQAWRFVAFSADKMRELVIARDYKYAVDRFLSDVKTFRELDGREPRAES